MFSWINFYFVGFFLIADVTGASWQPIFSVDFEKRKMIFNLNMLWEYSSRIGFKSKWFLKSGCDTTEYAHILSNVVYAIAYIADTYVMGNNF